MSRVKLPYRYDFSGGSANPYTVELRHGLIPRCPHCKIFVRVTLDGSEYWAYFMQGALVQDAFPNLTPEQRELLITGTHPECWDAMMGPEQ